jgi:hypothetical protein
MKKTSLLLLALLFASLVSASFGSTALVSANPEGAFPVLSMPVEYVNYTIVSVDGSLWAKVDGDYPIYVLTQSDCPFNGELPMVYPMPPNTTNIHLFLENTELEWSNYTQTYAEFLHHTAIRDWSMIYSEIGPVADFFELKIHYEHPVEVRNGSYIFLYDLNISPYLTPQNSNSTCNYTIRMETNITNLNIYTTTSDSQWNPINYTTTTQGSQQVISIREVSDYYKTLPGDLVVTFMEAKQVPEFPFWAFPALTMIAVLAIGVYLKRKGQPK